MTTFAPRTADEVTDAIRWALSAGEALEILGSGSRRALGRPMKVANILDVSALSGIVSYEPEELVMTALAGTPMSVIEAAVAEHSQWLAFEPPVTGTLGGIIATGSSGPRRFKAGAARDHVLGMAAVSGRGEAFVGGGKVVKNVTGYDIPKLMTGSYGTLAVLTEITVKTLPAPERASTVCVAALGVRDAVHTMTGALQSSLDISGACHVPRGVAVPGTSGDASVTAFRLEGFEKSVAARLQSLRAQLSSTGSLSVLEGEESRAFWRAIRDVAAFSAAGFDVMWKISVPPAASAAVAERLERAVPGARLFLDWGGGLIWLASHASAGQRMPGAPDSSARETPGEFMRNAALVREALGETGGHATLVRAPEAMRATVEVFQPQSVGVAALTKRLKTQFDPAHVLNPGRMYAGV